MRILLIEDDNLIGDGIKTGLEKSNFTVDWFDNGEDGEEALYQAPYDAVVLDLSLPGKDGLEILQQWRRSNYKIPVLILTARGDVESRIAGLNQGADDYLGKPFSLQEVIARINALMRRQGGYAAAELKFGDIRYQPGGRKVWRNNVEIELSPREKALLELFMLNKNRVLSKEHIEEKLYSWDDEVQSNAVEVHIHNLRKKLGRNIIRTINKIGYVMEEQVEV